MLGRKQVYEMLCDIASVYEDRKKELSDHDAVIGDGDHGFSLARGNQAARKKIEQLGPEAPVHELLKQYGRELTCEVGGAMGPLFGLLFTQTGKACVECETLGLEQLRAGLEEALHLICELGGAQVGDKTMVDAIAPAVEALRQAAYDECSFSVGVNCAAMAAWKGVESTVLLQARRGRSKYMREKSIGHQDAGATSFYYLMKTIADYRPGGQDL